MQLLLKSKDEPWIKIVEKNYLDPLYGKVLQSFIKSPLTKTENCESLFYLLLTYF